MQVWVYDPKEKVTKQQEHALPVEKECLRCKGHLLRLAERAERHPYAWLPCGYICIACNTIYMTLP